MTLLLSTAAPPAGVALAMEHTVDDDGILHDLEHDHERETLQVDLLVRAAPFRKTCRTMTEYIEVLLDFIMELFSKAVALIFVPEVGFYELRAGNVPDFQPALHAFFALRAISRTSSQV